MERHMSKGNREKVYSIWFIMFIIYRFSRACPVIDHEFRHNTVKVAVDPQPTL